MEKVSSILIAKFIATPV